MRNHEIKWPSFPKNVSDKKKMEEYGQDERLAIDDYNRIIDPEYTTNKIKILCVDDNPGILEGYKDIFVDVYHYGYPKCAVNGAHALEILSKEPFDLLITGIKMPVMDGIELLEKIRDQCPNMKRIVVTAYFSEQIVKKAIELGALAYISKPFTPLSLMQTLKQIGL